MYFPAETSWEYSGKTHDYFNGTIRKHENTREEKSSYSVDVGLL